MAAGGVGKRIARRAVMLGWPNQSLPPFIELMVTGSTVHKEMAVFRDSWEEAAVTKGEAARQAAEEAMAARISMKSALQSAKMSQMYAAKVIEKLEADDFEMPEISPKLIYQIIRSLESSTTVVEKAMKIEQMQMGRPENILGIEIGILLERCSNEELEAMAGSGELPDRILDQRRRVVEAVGTSVAEDHALADAEVSEPTDAKSDLESDLTDAVIEAISSGVIDVNSTLVDSIPSEAGFEQSDIGFPSDGAFSPEETMDELEDIDEDELELAAGV
jgi:uncharacterized protein (UPF0147 family)